MIVDIGGGATEAAVIALGGVVTHKSVRIGGNKVDEVIVEHIRKKNNIVIGEQTAEMIKMQIGSAVKLKRPETMEISGRDAVYGLPKNITIDSDEIYEAIRPTLDLIINAIRGALENTHPELVADILDRGIVLSGGMANLRNFNVLVTREIGVSAHIAIDPQLCVIRGTGIAVENLDVYRRAIR